MSESEMARLREVVLSRDAEIKRLRERIANALDALNDDDISGATLILYGGVREAPDND